MKVIKSAFLATLACGSAFPVDTREKRYDGGLPLSGGLLNGILQPLTGVLAVIDIPTPQPQGLKRIPADDPNHQFQAPGPTDIHDIFPILNTLTNHGYISHNGITTLTEAPNAVQTGCGFSYPLSVFLSAVGLLAGGDLLTGKYPIGGADSRVPNNLRPANGLDKHGVVEVDGSITWHDVYFGNNANFIVQRRDEYVSMSKEFGNDFDEQTQGDDVTYRCDNSQATNLNFFVGLPNGTTPDRADYANVARFFLNKTFSGNWYRRGEELTLPSAFEEALTMALENFRPPVQNQGLNNFVPIDLDISQYTSAEFGCFVLSNIFDGNPGQITADVYGLWMGFMKGVVASFFTNGGYFNCHLTSFVTPSASAGVSSNGSFSSPGSPINGTYPGIGLISPDSQPS